MMSRARIGHESTPVEDPFYRPVLPPIGHHAPDVPADAKENAPRCSHPRFIALSIAAPIIIAGIVLAVTLSQRNTSETVCVGITEEGCNSTLSASLQYVASNCEHDVGICSGEYCGNCNECCGPVFEETTEACGGEQVIFSRVTGCNCHSCANFPLAISGRVIGDCSNNVSCAMSIRVGGVEVTKSNTDGYFTFPVTYPSSERIVMNVVDTAGLYNDKTKLVRVSRSSQSYVNLEISVSLKPAPITFDARNGTTLNLGESESVTLVVPANSTYDEDGNLFEGEVDLALSFIDTDSDNETANIAGELSVEVNGEVNPMVSYGMLDMSISSGNTSLTANGVSIELSEDAITNTTAGNVSLWPFDERTGLWGSSSPLQRATDIRIRKGRSARNTNTVLTATINLSSIRRIWNLDRLVGSYCYMKVRIFNDEENTQNNQVWGGKVTSIYRRANGGWTNYIERWSWSYGACLNVPCDRYGWAEVDKVYIFVNGYHSYDPHQVSDELKNIVSFKAEVGAFEITIPQTGSIPTSSKGPFYRKYDWRCYSYSSFEGESYFRFVRKFKTTTTTAIQSTTGDDGSGSGETTVASTTTAADTTTSDTMDGSGSDETTTASTTTTSDDGSGSDETTTASFDSETTTTSVNENFTASGSGGGSGGGSTTI